MEICELEVGIDNTKSQIATSVEVLEQYKVQSKSLEEEVAEGKVSLKFVIRGRGEDIKKNNASCKIPPHEHFGLYKAVDSMIQQYPLFFSRNRMK